MNNPVNPEIELSIVLPCLNEAETVGLCVDKALHFISMSGISGEVVVADNGSSDGSDRIAREHGARVVYVAEKGYGSALAGGITAAFGKYVIMGDSDDSHDLENLLPFVDKLREGYELVVGNRFSGGIDPGAMSFINKYIGNPLLSGIGRIFYRSSVRDFHCGLRAFTKEVFEKMDLRTTGMEFASEMIVKASLFGVKMTEVPTRMAPSGRSRPPHLRSYRDGWRHLRFLLLFSPRWLFLYPGFALIVLGMLGVLWLLPGAHLTLDIHTMLYAATALLIGFHALSFAILSKFFAVNEKLLPEHPTLTRLLNYFTLEKGLIIGALLILAGLGGSVYAVSLLGSGQFRMLGITTTMRIIIPSVTMLLLGFQIVFTSFFYSILKLKLR